MEKMTIEKYLVDRWQKQYDYHSKNAKLNKRAYHVARVLEIIFAAMIPVVNSIAADKDWWDYAVSVIGLAISLLAGLLLLYKFHESWVDSRLTAESLGVEKYMYAMRAGVYKTGQADDKFVERVERIIAGAAKEWTKDHLDEPEK